MRHFLGCVIRESLLDPTPLAGWEPAAERVFEMPDDPDAQVWHVAWFQEPPGGGIRRVSTHKEQSPIRGG